MSRLARLAVLALVLAVSAMSTSLMAQTLKITSPADGTVVRPGETITVTVTVSGGTVPLVVLGVTFRYHAMLMAPPHRFSVRIPSEATLGRYVYTNRR
jgi:hypothetical protein